MSVRPANFVDIPRIVEIIREAHGRSVYAGRGEVDTTYAKRLLAQSIQRHGGTHEGSTLVLVSERAGAVEGVIVGMLDRVQVFGDKLWATDLFFIGTRKMPPMDALAMLNGLAEWAEKAPACIEVKVGVTSVVGDWQRAKGLYERAGFAQVGALYERRIER